MKNQWFIGHDTEQIWDYEFVMVFGSWEKRRKLPSTEANLVTFSIVDQNGRRSAWMTKDKTFQGYKTPRLCVVLA